MFRAALCLIMSVLFIMTGTEYAFANGDLDWVGNMFPSGHSTSILPEGEVFNVYTQVHRGAELPGQENAIDCTLYWSEVERFGGEWQPATETPMTYNGNVGNNDEYRASIRPGIGLYEFTTRCSSHDTGVVLWSSANGNGQLTVSPLISSATDRRAIWVEESIIAWNYSEGATYEIHFAPNGDLMVPVRSGLGIPLYLDRVLNWKNYPKFPNLGGYDAWRIPREYLSQIPEILRSEAAITAYNASGKLVATTRIQMQGVLDDLYSYSGELGVIYSEGIPTLKLWAPTAQKVTLQRFQDADPNTKPILNPMQFDANTGVWTITGEPSWDRQYYRYQLQVYVPTTGKIENNLVTDPYSISLSENSRLSQIVNLDDPSLKPECWDTVTKPTLAAPEDIAIYEVHVRDFSRDDATVDQAHRGTFKAFTYDGHADKRLSDGMHHLLNLAQAGLTHIHLMPAFDFASVEENPTARIDPNPRILASFGPNFVEQQGIIGSTRGNDSFNWGYDPYHFAVPEGSYATVQDGPQRILEFREMVKTLSQNGLRVVMDMVFNHTAANGLYTQAVLDKVVPGYYHRYTNDGFQMNSSCCSDTATEFDMMQKLMIDTVILWVKAYKVDGFRFDLMNLIPADAMITLRNRIRSLTPAKDGVNGAEIYLYGEGWDFGSARDKGFYHGNQYNMAGTGIGTFNDQIRDAIHGGSADDATEIRRQGFINGQSYDWNGHFYGRRLGNDLRHTSDKLRIALAGSLQNYKIVDQNNNLIDGKSLNGSGYTRDPQETINYASSHDNETLFDLNIFKMPQGKDGMAFTSMEERVRSQNMAISLVGLSQGIPSFHMGTDMLRSKSLDHNSYDSGDWFNRLDFTYHTNNFGVGLPPAWSNQSRWSIMAPLLGDSGLKPTQENILDSVAHLQEILKIRKSSKLFRLETEGQIIPRVRFHNTGSLQKNGLIAMSISDRINHGLDPNYEQVVVLFNANKFGQTLTIPDFKGISMSLHPVQSNSHDPLVKTASFNSQTGEFQVPGRTTAVFVALDKR